jgi:hypothetical protein
MQCSPGVATVVLGVAWLADNARLIGIAIIVARVALASLGNITLFDHALNRWLRQR